VNDPRSIGLLQDASKANNTKTFKKFVESTWRMVCYICLCLLIFCVYQNTWKYYLCCQVKACTLRGQMEFTFAEKPLDLAEVEPAASIVKRFCTGK
jgi:glutamate synthase (NADPH/NADH)